MSDGIELPVSLRSGRVHEAYGPGALAFGVVLCAQAGGLCLWIRERWQAETLNPTGLASVLDPARLLLARTKDQTDSLAVAEEALKDGAVRLVVIETTKPLNLREGRRLQLAAQSGGAIGLCLTPEGFGSNAAETRWHCLPFFDPSPRADSTLMRWEIMKNKSGTLGVWHVRWDAQTHRLDVVSPAGGRSGDATAAE